MSRQSGILTPTQLAESDPVESPTRPPAISWGVARRVASAMVSKSSLSALDWTALRSDFNELVPIAESQVTRFTGLVVHRGRARAQVVDRAGWIEANAESFQRLLTPLLEGLPQRTSIFGGAIGEMFGSVGRTVSGTELGTLLGWMSGKVLGQYDAILASLRDRDDPVGGESNGEVIFVGPNILEIERRYGFPARQFRLWIALHELTHRAQFLGVPWMQEYFFGLVDSVVSASLPEPGKLFEAVRNSLGRSGKGFGEAISEAGLLGLFMDDSQRESLGKIQGLMSLLEGHGDVVMDRAATELVPLAGHFSSVLSARRRRASGLTRAFMVIVGMDAKMRQYALGEHFVKTVEDHGGRELFDQVWVGPENLPSFEEISSPERWIERITSA